MNTPARVTSNEYDRPYRPRLIAAINAVGRATGPSRFDAAALMETARRKTGLSDFGDGSFRGRMDLLLDSIEKEARLHPWGRFIVRQNLVRFLSNRLRIEDAVKKHPEIMELPMEDPVFIVGLQRTGTTMLHRLLASDSANFRFLASWEAINPAPLSGAAKSGKPDRGRLRVANLASRALKYMAPDFFAIHPIDTLDPEEDCLLFDYDFRSTVPEATMRVPLFSKWLEEQDHTDAYRYYRKVLRYLYWQNPHGRWILKTPQHMEHFDEIFSVFPDARIIQTHRDPARVVASFCSMVSHAYGVFSDEVDPVEIGRHWSRKALLMVGRSMDIRGRISAGRFIDVNYADLMSDQEGAVRRVYASLGLPFSGADAERVHGWGTDNPQHKHGTHSYRLEDFGLTRAGIEKNFKPYRERFGIPVEGGRE